MSLKETSFAVRQNRKRIWRGKCPSHPKAVAEAIRKYAAGAALVVLETGSLTTRFYRELAAEGLPAVCIDARHAKAALATAPNKTDANDADSLAVLAEACFFREVRVKSFEAMRMRALIGGRAELVGISTKLSNQIRGLMKTLPRRGKGRRADIRGQCQNLARRAGSPGGNPLALA